MPDISKIILPSGSEYSIKDEVARSTAGGGIRFKGITSTILTDGSNATTYLLDGETVEAQNGDMVIYNTKEFIYSIHDSCWHEFGDNSSFGALAYKENAVANYTPEGTISEQLFTGTQGNLSVSGTPTGNVEISIGQGTTNFTPEGTITKPNVTVTLDSSTGYVADDATGGGTVTPGAAAQCTMPVLNCTVENEALTIGWTAGNFTPNTPTTVQLPTFTQKTIASSVASASLDATPEFTGTAVDLEATFIGANMTATGTYTPEGVVSRPTFQGTLSTITAR